MTQEQINDITSTDIISPNQDGSNVLSWAEWADLLAVNFHQLMIALIGRRQKTAWNKFYWQQALFFVAYTTPIFVLL